MKVRSLPLTLCAVFLGGLGMPVAALAQATNHISSELKSAIPYQTAEEIEDLGEIREAGPQTTAYRAAFSADSTLTSNAKLSGNHSSGDVIFFPMLTGGLHKQLTPTVSFDFEGKLESALYSRYSDRSFGGYSSLATLDWRPKADRPRLYIAVEPYRYDSYDSGDLITQAVGTTLGTDWQMPFNQGFSQLWLGYSFTEYFSDPSIDSRGSHRLTLAVSHAIRPKLSSLLLYSLQHTDFDNTERRDWRQSVILSLIYQVREHFFGTVSANFIHNDSNEDVAAYESAGLSLGVTWQF